MAMATKYLALVFVERGLRLSHFQMTCMLAETTLLSATISQQIHPDQSLPVIDPVIAPINGCSPS